MAFDFTTFGTTTPSKPGATAVEPQKPASGSSFDFASFGTPTPPPNVPDITPSAPDTFATDATFQATGDESTFGKILKIIGNTPGSAARFAAGTIKSLNPVKIAENIGEIPGQFVALSKETGGVAPALEAFAKAAPEVFYKGLVPKFIQHTIAGDYTKAAATIENDPVGQILPLVMLGRGVAQATGKEAAFDSAISTIAKPVTIPASKVAAGTGSLLSQILGASTGAGASSVKSAFEASPEFTAALRGKIEPDEVVQDVQDAVQNIKQARGDAYTAELAKIGEDTRSHDISPIINSVQSNLKRFNIRVDEDGKLDFSRSAIANNGSARADIQGVFDTVKDWGSQAGDRTGVGIDTLKKQLADFYSPSGQARAFVQSVKSAASDLLNNEVKGYKEMTRGYAKATAFLDDIKSATGVGGRAKADTVFTKLSTAMKGDKEFRLEVLSQIGANGGSSGIMDKIAGINLSSKIPRGLVGKGADIGAAFGFLAGHINPSFIPALLATSPRVVGEFVRALGLSAQATNGVIQAVNKLAPIAEYLTPGALLQENQQPEGQPQNKQ